MKRQRSAWTWIPSLYFTEGIVYVVVTTVSAMLFKRLGFRYADITTFASWLYLPWVLVPLWKAYADRLRAPRLGIGISQLILGIALAITAYTVKEPTSVLGLLAGLGIVAFCSSVVEVFSDNYYSRILDEDEQSHFLGPRSKIFYAATIVGMGLILMIAGGCEVYFRNVAQAWTVILLCLAALIIILAIYHLVILVPSYYGRAVFSPNFSVAFRTFLSKKNVWLIILFILLFNLPKALISKVGLLFLIDPSSKGGLALSLTQIGFAQGTIGIVGLTFGSIIGSNLVARDGIRRWVWLMVLALTLPNLLYVYLSMLHITHFGLICACIFTEQFGYGFGLTFFLGILMHFSEGEYETSHFGICNALMTLGLMIPGILSGQLLVHQGYANFFIIASILGIITILLAFIVQHKFKNT